MSLENRYLKYSKEITEEVYNEVIEVLEDNGKTPYDRLTSYYYFKNYGNIKTYTSAYRCDGSIYLGQTEITVAEILQHKKNVEHKETRED